MVTAVKVSQRDHTNAVVAKLETIVGLDGVGRGIRHTRPDGSAGPDGEGRELVAPCVVVFPLTGGSRFGTLDDVGKHASLLYQLNCYGRVQEECEWVRDQTEILLDGLVVAGRNIDVVRADFGSANADRDDTVGAPWFLSQPRYRITSYA